MSLWTRSVASMELPMIPHVLRSTALAWHLLISSEELVQVWYVHV